MLHVSSSLPYIAVLRGGKKEFKQSLKEGVEVLTSLTKIGYQPLDVLVGTDGAWTMHGKPTDAHEVFTRSHTIVDTTHMHGEAYQALASRMGISVIFSHGDTMCVDREDMYRLLRQQGFDVPDTDVIRAKTPLTPDRLHSLWRKHHAPLMVHPLRRKNDVPSQLVTTFHDLENTIDEYQHKGIDTQLLTYRRVLTSSVAVVPDFRGEKLYVPLWVETSSAQQIPNSSSQLRPQMRTPHDIQEKRKAFVTRVYEALDLSGPACIDMIPYRDGYMVVNVEVTPSLRAEGRFMQSLQTTGIDVGQYIHSRIHHEFER